MVLYGFIDMTMGFSTGISMMIPSGDDEQFANLEMANRNSKFSYETG